MSSPVLAGVPGAPDLPGGPAGAPASTAGSATPLAGLPRVDLLPPEYRERRRVRRVQLVGGGAAAAAAAVVAGLHLVAAGQADAAREGLAESAARGAGLAAQEATYADVPRALAALDAAERARESALGQEVRWSEHLDGIARTLPTGVWLTDLTITQAVDAPPVAPTDGWSVPRIATITVGAKAYAHTDAAAWMEEVVAGRGLAQPYVTASTELDETGPGGEPLVSFTGQVAVTADALSGRYTSTGD